MNLKHDFPYIGGNFQMYSHLVIFKMSSPTLKGTHCFLEGNEAPRYHPEACRCCGCRSRCPEPWRGPHSSAPAPSPLPHPSSATLWCTVGHDAMGYPGCKCCLAACVTLGKSLALWALFSSVKQGGIMLLSSEEQCKAESGDLECSRLSARPLDGSTPAALFCHRGKGCVTL